jgi:ribosome modulation factor
MEEVCERENLQRALQRVKAGVAGSVGDRRPYADQVGFWEVCR